MALTTETPARYSLEGALPALTVEQSARVPLLLLVASALKWFAISALFGTLAFASLHAPGMGKLPFLTYGRVQPVFVDALVYGFLTNAAIAAGLYLICRLGRNTLALPSLVTVATLFYNIALTVALVLILAGYNSSQQLFEFPKGPAIAMFISFLPFALSAFLTNARRTVAEMYPTQWFVLAGFICFPWLLSTAIWMIHLNNVTPMVHPSVHQWYANGVVALWLVPVALGAIYYFTPKLSGRTLHSSGLAAFGFWTYIFFAGFGGFQFTSVLPRWYPAVSAAVAVLLLIPAASNFLNWQRTITGLKNRPEGQTWHLIRVSSVLYVIATVLAALTAAGNTANFFAFTFVVPGLFFLTTLGVVGFALLATIYYMVPRLTGCDWGKSIVLQRRLTIFGSMLLILALLIGGLRHAGGLNDPGKDFMSVLRSTFPFVGMGTVAMLVLLVSQLAGIGALMRNFYGCCCGSANDRTRTAGRTH
ncbi:MAG TPA: cbb3-type cytochrome c oxidase subunit I [Methylomirabilota bacterium]|nr:cbb3-type cytochrome c oxidase subunit I [Methylomirabilota bacterium]